MNKRKAVLKVAGVLIAASLVGCSSMGSMGSAMSLFDQLGGMSAVTKLASGMVSSSLSDPRLSGLLAGKSVDTTAATSKVSNQLCAMLGGGCQAPMTDDQLSSAA